MVKKLFRILLRTILALFILSIITTILYRFVPVPVTPLMVQRYFEMEEGKIDKDWKSLEEISPSLPLAVVTSEDQKFEDHYGFDLEAIEKAVKYNEKHKGKKVRTFKRAVQNFIHTCLSCRFIITIANTQTYNLCV